MKLIIGLGNPGKQYEKTRHNIGFMVLDALAGNENWNNDKKAKGLFIKTKVNNTDVELIKPQTFMNESGFTVAYAIRKHNIDPKDVIVIHDDKDLLLGEYKIQNNRGPAGHNGVKSIIKHLKTQDFTRIRVGVASDNPRKMSDTSKFVLNKFGLFEKKKVKEVINKVIQEINNLI
ncbi:aminoacyl-tRNA hydrolase [bacterium]|jgi:peptidyl-tRNA hydrolase, PTH1 family|nr:aminoacyl-tRNA hydrolase [bacterium]MBT4122250.1 aminoacyl-tRNA hydrolase [bacterium]MBT4496021.1 aminoacyl-tRNA hydrolase [bacterium]MBT4763832.1 aminoacyl-tRNA hydrolase [bacterium]MBT5401202.1 aminoacyl-tRNA hydrolase [bacterium]